MNRFWKGALFLILIGMMALTGCKKPREFIFVIDSSGSMAGKKDTIGKFKRTMPKLLETVNTGDTVTLISFDEKTMTRKTVHIESEADLQQILDSVNRIKATGMYTDFVALIRDLKGKVEAENRDKNNLIIVVLSDGLDDPRPGKRQGEFSLEAVRAEKEGPVQEPYIYYVSLGKMKSKELEKGLSSLSSSVKTIEATEADQTGLGRVSEEIAWKKIWDLFYPVGFYVLAAILLIPTFFFLIGKLFRGPDLSGQLVYYPDGLGQVRNYYNLKKLKSNRMTIGNSYGSNLKIKDLGIPGPLFFLSKRVKGSDLIIPLGKSSTLINFLEQKRQGTIQNGDKFKIGNYVFEYKDEASKEH